eukprot:SAG31_NODE_962_length_10731_cov_4.198552_2_plen_64_part_00
MIFWGMLRRATPAPARAHAMAGPGSAKEYLLVCNEFGLSKRIEGNRVYMIRLSILRSIGDGFD